MSSEYPAPSSPNDPKTPWETFDDLYDSICDPLMIIPQAEEHDTSPTNIPPANNETWEIVYQGQLNVYEYYEAFTSSSRYQEYRKNNNQVAKWEFWTGLRPELQREVSPERFDDVQHMQGFTRMKEIMVNRLRQLQQEEGTSSKERPAHGSLEKRNEELAKTQENETGNVEPSPGPRKRGRPKGSKSKKKKKGSEREFGEDSQMRVEYF